MVSKKSATFLPGDNYVPLQSAQPDPDAVNAWAVVPPRPEYGDAGACRAEFVFFTGCVEKNGEWCLLFGYKPPGPDPKPLNCTVVWHEA